MSRQSLCRRTLYVQNACYYTANERARTLAARLKHVYIVDSEDGRNSARQEVRNREYTEFNSRMLTLGSIWSGFLDRISA